MDYEDMVIAEEPNLSVRLSQSLILSEGSYEGFSDDALENTPINFTMHRARTIK
ncbi:hypothetical protein Bhyg_04782 [Pseudolycoriella hygida]|uniref:Uncharacterized protein n=1 Tax=Pseudolycoriella hygida TaxID=35572 RepID=A0A9Q0NG35_9DIPT|nr:hypothetical protein Bhyg_04782 [Pseudolycoriella hygida]